MKKRILSCLMALALCLTLLPTAALAEETEGTAQTSPAVEESTDPANGEAKQESQPAETKQENQSAAPEQENQPAEAKREGQSAEQEEQQEDSAAKQAVANVQAMIDDLPDAAELDGMDDEDAMAVYEAFQTACDAYYETLTEGQQAQLKNTEKLEALSAWFSQSAALAAGGHQHPICGASCTDDENHDNVTWRGASNVTGLKAGGHYYLIRDVKVSETWHPEDGVVLCLNGYSITATEKGINVIEVDKGKTFTLTDCGTAGTVTHEAEKRGRGVMVFGTFNLYGGNITGNQTDGNYNDRGTFGAGVYVATYSVFNMYGGKITDNMGYSGGGSVYVAPTYADSSRAVFNMSGGEISGNSSLYGNSSGVYVNGGEFIMSGGSITGNAGYGVDLCDYKNNVGATYPGAFTVSGKVSVTGNYKNVYNNGTLVGTLDYNVFLSTGKTITVEGTLDAASKIGITTQGEASADIATGGVGEDYESIFSSDVKDKGYSFTKKDDGTLHFNGHDHNWQFAATTDMIWAKCATPGCPVTTIDSIGTEHCNGGFVWLKVQDTTYGSNSKNAWVDPSKQTTWRGPAVSTIEIYYRNSETGEDLGTTAPTLPGSYTASITVGGLTVTRDFTITKATPTGTPGYTKLESSGKTLADAKLTVGTIRPAGTIAWDLPLTTILEDGKAYAWTFTPNDTHNYTILTGTLVPYVDDGMDYIPGVIGGNTGSFNFHDVSRLDYFYDAVKWAAENGIASGTGRYTFSPNAVCTRAQTVTFLWRAAGSPLPRYRVCPFTDVNPRDYYYDAVLWAVEQGITTGLNATTFGPDVTVTRGQVATFLYRAASAAKPSTFNPFTDVKTTAYNYNAILWAYDNRITTGTSDNDSIEVTGGLQEGDTIAYDADAAEKQNASDSMEFIVGPGGGSGGHGGGNGGPGGGGPGGGF